MNIVAWQGGLILGAAVSLIADVIARAIIARVRWNRHHRDHRHCEHCNGCLDDDGSGIGAVHKLVYCEICNDTAIGSLAAPEKRFLPIEHYFEEQRRRRDHLQ